MTTLGNAELEDDVDDVDQDAQGQGSAGDDGPPPLVYGSVDEFVREYLCHMYKRTLDSRNRRWAAEWWAYDEAVVRLEALWRAWEHLRQEPGLGMSTWWLEHADPHMAALFHQDGPFRAAPELSTSRGDPLPYTPPPDGMFPDQRG